MRCIARCLALCLVSALTAATAPALEIFVDTAVDELADNGNCSLREAIAAANTDLAVDACPAGHPSFDFIYLPMGAEIVLELGPLVIERGLGIYGDGNRLAASGSDPQRLFVLDLDGEDFEMYGAWNGTVPSVLVGGASTGAGGAIHVGRGRNVHLEALWFEDHTAAIGGAIGFGDSPAMTSVSLTVEDCRFRRNSATAGDGGAIALSRTAEGELRDGSLKIFGSQFSGNLATGDGGAVSWPTLQEGGSALGIQLRGVVFADNAAGGVGGALHIPSAGGILAGPLLVIDNQASTAGGAFLAANSLDLESSALVRNHAASAEGIANLEWQGGDWELGMTAITDAGLGLDCDFATAPTRWGVNLEGDGSCALELQGSAQYGPVGSWGPGGRLLAYPAVGSPVIDAWEAALCPDIWARDLVGNGRPLDGDGDGVAACDIGPLEVVAPYGPLFFATFESGDLSGWSAAVGD